MNKFATRNELKAMFFGSLIGGTSYTWIVDYRDIYTFVVALIIIVASIYLWKKL